MLIFINSDIFRTKRRTFFSQVVNNFLYDLHDKIYTVKLMLIHCTTNKKKILNDGRYF